MLGRRGLYGGSRWVALALEIGFVIWRVGLTDGHRIQW